MADTKITDLTALAVPAGADLVVVVDDVVGTPTTKKATLSNFTKGLDAATASAKGIVELATSGETNTGTDATRAVTPDGLEDWTGSAQVTTVGTLASGDADAIVTDAAADGATKGKAAFTATDFNAASGVISLDFTNAQKASTTQAGFLTEVAIASEINTGTDAARANSPDALAGSYAGTKIVGFIVIEAATDCAADTAIVHAHIPASMNAMEIVSAHAEVVTAGTTGVMTVDINKNGSTMLSTKLTVDTGETGSDTAAAAVAFNTDGTEDVATNDVISIDIDGVHTTAAKGLVVTLEFRLQ